MKTEFRLLNALTIRNDFGTISNLMPDDLELVAEAINDTVLGCLVFLPFKGIRQGGIAENKSAQPLVAERIDFSERNTQKKLQLSAEYFFSMFRFAITYSSVFICFKRSLSSSSLISAVCFLATTVFVAK